MWEGMIGGAVWTRMIESYKGKSKEGFAIPMLTVWKCESEYR